VLVAQDATVRLIDCDSFQVINGSRRFLCEVGVETFTPPELQGKPFKGVVRNQNHDDFGLAVLIFLMLFMGRHPFAGRYLGPDQMPIPRAIKECRFAYGARRATVQMEKPPGTPALSILGDDVAFLFERAFAKEMIAGGRPTPREWIDGLERLEKTLKRCSANPSHWHRNDTSCPWCPMEGATGVTLFPIIADIAASAVNIDALWLQVEALPHPGQPPAFSAPAVQTSQAAKSAGSANHDRKVIASVVAGIMIAISAGAGRADRASPGRAEDQDGLEHEGREVHSLPRAALRTTLLRTLADMTGWILLIGTLAVVAAGDFIVAGAPSFWPPAPSLSVCLTEW
jgi:hypothetical protein